jgi:hypothetical protein
MKKIATVDFQLTQKEVKEAIYDYFVRKLKSHNINAFFTPDDIDMKPLLDDNVVLRIQEEKELE